MKGYTDVANTEGYRLLDVNNDTTNETYYSEWDQASRTNNQLYERAKWLSQENRLRETRLKSWKYTIKRDGYDQMTEVIAEPIAKK